MNDEELKKKFIAEFQAKVAAQMKIMRAARAAEFAARKKENRKLQMQISYALYLLKEDLRRLAQTQKRTQDNLRLRNIRRLRNGNWPPTGPA